MISDPLCKVCGPADCVHGIGAPEPEELEIARLRESYMQKQEVVWELTRLLGGSETMLADARAKIAGLEHTIAEQYKMLDAWKLEEREACAKAAADRIEDWCCPGCDGPSGGFLATEVEAAIRARGNK